jgi:hypothetical protein
MGPRLQFLYPKNIVEYGGPYVGLHKGSCDMTQ